MCSAAAAASTVKNCLFNTYQLALKDNLCDFDDKIDINMLLYYVLSVQSQKLGLIKLNRHSKIVHQTCPPKTVIFPVSI